MMTRSDERGETNYGLGLLIWFGQPCPDFGHMINRSRMISKPTKSLRNDLNNLRLTQTERQSESGFGSGSSVGTNVRLGRNPR